MKKTKRLLSMLTALAITASAFASMVIPASAATAIDGASYDFEGGTEAVWAVDDSSHAQIKEAGVVSVVKDDTLNSNVLGIYKDGVSGGRAGKIYIPSVITPTAKGVVQLDFKFYSATTGANGNFFTGTFQDSDENGIFSVGDVLGTGVQFNGVTLEGLDRTNWHDISVVMDFETHKIVSATFTKHGDSAPAATVKNVDFISASAANIAAIGINCGRNSGTNANIRTAFDDVTAYDATDDYFAASFTVTDSDNTPVSDATITIDGTDEYTTDANGKVTLKLKNGSHTYSIYKIGYQDASGQETITGSVSESGADVNATYSLKPYTPEVTSATVGGGQAFIVAPDGSDPSKSAEFTVSVKDQNETDMEEGYTTAWAVYPTGTTTADANVTIAGGVVSVGQNYTAGTGKDVAVYDVVATVTDSNDETKTATNKSTITIANSDILLYDMEGSYTASGAKSKDYDIDDVAIPSGGAHIKFEFTKGVYDSTSDSANGQLLFKSGDDTIFYLEDMNSDKIDGRDKDLMIYTDAGNSASLGNTARNEWHTIDITIIGSMLIASFDDDENKVVEFAAAPTSITSISATTSQSGGSGTGATKLVMSSKLTIDKNMVNIKGPIRLTSIPGNTVKRQYTAKPIVPEASDNFTWSVTETTGVSIDAETGVLSIEDTAEAGMVTVTATSGTKTGSTTVAITPARIESYDLVGSTTLAYEDGLTESYAITNVKDQNGDDITEYVIPAWSIKGAEPVSVPKATIPVEKTGSAVAIFTTYAENALESVSVKPINIPADATSVDIEGAPGQKVMIWDSLDNMEPIGTGAVEITGEAPSVTYITNSGTLTVNEKENVTLVASAIGETIEIPVTIADFSKIIDAEEGDVDVSDLVTYGTTTFSVVLDNGTVLTKTAEDDQITLTADELGDAVEAEVIPNYKFNLGGADANGYVTVSGTKADGYGFTAEATPEAGTGTGIQSKGVNLDSNSFEVDLPDGRYDMTFYKADTNSTHIRVNEYMTLTEADFNQSSDSKSDTHIIDPLTVPGVYTKLDVNVTGGVAKINAYNWYGIPLMAAVEITKKSEDFQPRKTHIWLAGDSTVCHYRPTPSTRDDWAGGTRRTGWGQLLQNYLGDDVIVEDFAHSGDWATNWYANTFSGVIQNAQAGDYLIIQFGINDRQRTPDKNEMAAALSNMVDECRAKGVIPVLQTPEICISQYGDVGEHGQSTGSGNAGWFNTNKTVAQEKNVLLIDLADISGKLWATMGRTWVANNYFINNTELSKVDTQHMSYQGAKLVASMVATEILDQQTAGKKGMAGETFDGIPVNAKVQADVTYTDASDDQSKTITRQAAEFKLKN